LLNGIKTTAFEALMLVLSRLSPGLVAKCNRDSANKGDKKSRLLMIIQKIAVAFVFCEFVYY
jgi:hypothetical protein